MVEVLSSNCMKIIIIIFFIFFIGSPNSLTLNDQPEVSDSVPAECWNFTHGDPNNMEFFSPNFPNLYPNNVNCAHYIEGKSKENI
jgi:hypothetical protein